MPRIPSNIDISIPAKDEKLFISRARLVLPYLVRQAKAGHTIYYSDLAKLVNMPNPRNLDRVLGAIGMSLINFGKDRGIEIPTIQCLVINKQTELPGEGFNWFISQEDYFSLNKTQRKIIINAQFAKIYAFPNWDWILKEFNLNPIPNTLENLLEQAKNSTGGSGESPAHKIFKDYISTNPSIFGLSSQIGPGIKEYKLPSADAIDVLFNHKEEKIGVEVKSHISSPEDILRGIFQCVKYKHLIIAEQIVNNQVPNCRVILALESKLPEKFELIKNLLDVEIKDQIKISN